MKPGTILVVIFFGLLWLGTRILRAPLPLVEKIFLFFITNVFVIGLGVFEYQYFEVEPNYEEGDAK